MEDWWDNPHSSRSSWLIDEIAALARTGLGSKRSASTSRWPADAYEVVAEATIQSSAMLPSPISNLRSAMCRQRNLIERFFCRRKQFRRPDRFDKLTRNFSAPAYSPQSGSALMSPRPRPPKLPALT